jgi:hypothetical protein
MLTAAHPHSHEFHVTIQVRDYLASVGMVRLPNYGDGYQISCDPASKQTMCDRNGVRLKPQTLTLAGSDVFSGMPELVKYDASPWAYQR